MTTLPRWVSVLLIVTFTAVIAHTFGIAQGMHSQRLKHAESQKQRDEVMRSAGVLQWCEFMEQQIKGPRNVY